MYEHIHAHTHIISGYYFTLLFVFVRLHIIVMVDLPSNALVVIECNSCSNSSHQGGGGGGSDKLELECRSHAFLRLSRIKAKRNATQIK